MRNRGVSRTEGARQVHVDRLSPQLWIRLLNCAPFHRGTRIDYDNVNAAKLRSGLGVHSLHGGVICHIHRHGGRSSSLSGNQLDRFINLTLGPGAADDRCSGCRIGNCDCAANASSGTGNDCGLALQAHADLVCIHTRLRCRHRISGLPRQCNISPFRHDSSAVGERRTPTRRSRNASQPPAWRPASAPRTARARPCSLSICGNHPREKSLSSRTDNCQTTLTQLSLSGDTRYMIDGARDQCENRTHWTVSFVTVVTLAPGGRFPLPRLADDAMALAKSLDPLAAAAPDLAHTMSGSPQAGYVDALLKAGAAFCPGKSTAAERHHHLIASWDHCGIYDQTSSIRQVRQRLALLAPGASDDLPERHPWSQCAEPVQSPPRREAQNASERPAGRHSSPGGRSTLEADIEEAKNREAESRPEVVSQGFSA